MCDLKSSAPKVTSAKHVQTTCQQYGLPQVMKMSVWIGRCYRDAPARHGTEDPQNYGTARHGNHGTENLGTARHGKSWHGKIMARQWPGKYHKHFVGENILWSKNLILPGSKIPLLAIHKIISHIWEDRSRKVNNDEPNFRLFHGNF